ncbi:hypothetical protein ACFWIQ_34965 [Kitasatospora sp. NPDC127059]|uniref:hypothetical protein n=1 Tax=Kitasatospora sp. NPDC127059 TaxID=3347120 RepID=UPI00364BE5C4
MDVYRRIMDRYGPTRVCTLSMPETCRVRHAIRDAGLALGLPRRGRQPRQGDPHITAR